MFQRNVFLSKNFSAQWKSRTYIMYGSDTSIDGNSNTDAVFRGMSKVNISHRFSRKTRIKTAGRIVCDRFFGSRPRDLHALRNTHSNPTICHRWLNAVGPQPAMYDRSCTYGNDVVRWNRRVQASSVIRVLPGRKTETNMSRPLDGHNFSWTTWLLSQ